MCTRDKEDFCTNSPPHLVSVSVYSALRNRDQAAATVDLLLRTGRHRARATVQIDCRVVA